MVGVDESPRRIAGRADVDEFNVFVNGKSCVNCVYPEWELRPRGGIEWDSDKANIVNVCRDGVHPICGWASEELRFPRCAEAA